MNIDLKDFFHIYISLTTIYSTINSILKKLSTTILIQSDCLPPRIICYGPK
jgi:hypothetical protein